MPKGIYPRKKSKQIKKILDNLKCENCGKHYVISGRSLKYLKTRKFCSRGCFKQHPNSKVGQFKIGHDDYNKSDSESPCWMGEDITYSTLHKWIVKKLGSAYKCEHCKTTISKKYEWANKDHKYKRNLKDWISLCTKCHRAYDKRFGKIGNNQYNKLGIN